MFDLRIHNTKIHVAFVGLGFLNSHVKSIGTVSYMQFAIPSPLLHVEKYPCLQYFALSIFTATLNDGEWGG